MSLRVRPHGQQHTARHEDRLAGATGAEPLQIGNHKQFFIDTQFFAEAHHVALRPYRGKDRHHTLEPDQPWKARRLTGQRRGYGKIPHVVRGHDVEDGPPATTLFCTRNCRWRAWAEAFPDLVKYHDIEQTNILSPHDRTAGARSRVHGAGVFLDRNAPEPERYKAVSQGIFAGLGDPPHRVAGMYSPDGLHWTRYPEPICPVFADSQYSAFRDARSGQYVLLGRVGGRGRAIGRSQSASFTRFDPLALVLESHERDMPQCDIYNPAAISIPTRKNLFHVSQLYRLIRTRSIPRSRIATAFADRPEPVARFVPLSPGRF